MLDSKTLRALVFRELVFCYNVVHIVALNNNQIWEMGIQLHDVWVRHLNAAEDLSERTWPGPEVRSSGNWQQLVCHEITPI